MSLKIEFKGTIARWLPEDPSIIREYQGDVLRQVIRKGIYSRDGQVDENQLSPVIRKFKNVIEENGELFRDFHEMFDELRTESDSDTSPIKNYEQLLACLDSTITTAPRYSFTSPLVSGVPMYGILAPFCNTPSGYHAFTSPKVNAMFHEIFSQWTEFLTSSGSCYVLDEKKEDSWLSADALKVQETRLKMRFQDAWVCNPKEPYWGFMSWDDFFGRRFRDGVRPTYLPGEPGLKYVNAACEAITYGVFSNVQPTDEFWLKDMPYSLNHILNFDPLALQFACGTVFQAMLSSLDYHRWHSPIDGRVVKTCIIPGTYYAALLDDDPDPDVVSRSQAFVTAISTRALIFIESNNPHIGLMCFVGVGLGEVSTTKLVVKEGDQIEKGDEIGSFHFGGSTHLLIFRPETELTLLPGPEDPNEARQVGTLLFHVDNKPPNQ